MKNMTVKKLIEILSKHPQDLDVKLDNSDHFMPIEDWPGEDCRVQTILDNDDKPLFVAIN